MARLLPGTMALLRHSLRTTGSMARLLPGTMALLLDSLRTTGSMARLLLSRLLLYRLDGPMACYPHCRLDGP